MYGAIFGDILGSPYEFEEIKYDDPATIELFHEDCHITDDSVLSFAVADWLLHDTRDVYYDDEKLKERLAERFVKWTRWSSIREMAFGNRYIQWFYKAEAFYQRDIPEGIVDFCVKRIPVKAIDLCREFIDMVQE